MGRWPSGVVFCRLSDVCYLVAPMPTRILGSILVLLLAFPAAAAPLRVVVDPGHGGEKEGAIGPCGTKEKDLALAISLRLAEALRLRGHEVILTRDRDVSLGLAPRIQLANERAADVFVSIHANSVAAAKDRVHGVETYFLSADATDSHAQALANQENADDEAAATAVDPLDFILADLARMEAHVGSSRLAVAIHENLVRRTGARDRGVRQAPFFVLSGAHMPAVLVEVGYVSHPAEERRLASRDNQEAIAQAIAEGIDAFGRRVMATASPER